jgi:hypothetical protein
MNNLKLECLKLAVEYWKGHNVTIDHMKDTADSIYDYCKEDEPKPETTKITVENDPIINGPYFGKTIPMNKGQYLKGEDITMPKKDK